MLVYGDPEYQVSWRKLVTRFKRKVEQIDRNDLDAFRALLMETGQLEQAISDLSDPGSYQIANL